MLPKSQIHNAIFTDSVAPSLFLQPVAPIAVSDVAWPLLTLCLVLLTALISLAIGVIFVKQDRKRLEQESEKQIAALKRDVQSAQESSLANTDFLSQINHEIRNPLAAIIGYSSLLKQQAGKAEEFVDGLFSSSQRLSEIVDDVLEVSKIESGVYNVEKVAFDLALTIHEVNEITSEKTDGKRVELECDHRSLQNRYIVSDEAKIRQIAINLISNAVKFTDNGRVSAVIDVRRPREDELPTLQLKVVDTGIGIPEEEREMVFDRFYKCSNNSDGSGSGLGLHVVKKIVDALNGTIELTSQVDVGSTFTVNIPVELADSGSTPKEPIQQKVLAQTETEVVAAPTSPPKVLVVDDQVEVRRMLELQLNAAGYQSQATKSMDEALSIVKTWKPNAVLLDIRIPGGDGFEILFQIRELTTDESVYVVAITGDATDVVKQECKVAGFDAFLTKPFQFGAVNKLMKSAGLGLPKSAKSNKPKTEPASKPHSESSV